MQISNDHVDKFKGAAFILMKVVFGLSWVRLAIDHYGVRQYDRYVLALSFGSLSFLANFAFTTRIRSLFRSHMKRASHIRVLRFLQHEHQRDGYISLTMCGLTFGSLSLILGREPAIVFLICAFQFLASYLVGVEYTLAFVGKNTNLRLYELLTSALLLAIWFIFPIQEIAVVGMFGVTYLVRLGACISMGREKLRFKPVSRRFQMPKVLNFGHRNICVRKLAWPLFANLVLAGSTFGLQAYAYSFFPPGSITKINLAYRFVNPISAIFGYLSFSSLNLHRFRRLIFPIFATSVAALTLATLTPTLSRVLFPASVHISAILALAAATHVVLQGINQNYSAALYNLKEYRRIFFATIPFPSGLALIWIASYFVHLESPLWIVLALSASAFIELFVMLNWPPLFAAREK